MSKPRNGRPPRLRLYLEPSGYYILRYGRKHAYLHRFLYALSTGKDIRRRHVHHKNGQMDNRPESLTDLSVAEHQRSHWMLGSRPMTNTEKSERRRRLHPERVKQEQRAWRQQHSNYQHQCREKGAAVV